MCLEFKRFTIAKKRGGIAFTTKGLFAQCRHGIWYRWHGHPGAFACCQCELPEGRGVLGGLVRYRPYRHRLKWVDVPDYMVPDEIKDKLYILAIERGKS